MFRLTRRSETRRLPPFIGAVMLLATSLWGAVAHAGNAVAVSILEYPISTDCADPGQLLLNVPNQYVLLLFFRKENSADVHHLFHTVSDPINPMDGCWTDPGDAKKNIKAAVLRVQGSCPSDCTRPSDLESRVANARKGISKGSQHSQFPGDPLKNPKDSLGWGLYFSDPSGNGDYSDEDDRTNFGVWQIAVADSLQAGRVLRNLYGETPFKNGAFIGHVLVGYTPPSKPSKAHQKAKGGSPLTH